MTPQERKSDPISNRIIRNVAAEAKKQRISKAEIGRRMTALGFTEWKHTKTLTRSFKFERPLRLDEAVALALVVNVPLGDLATDQPPSGALGDTPETVPPGPVTVTDEDGDTFDAHYGGAFDLRGVRVRDVPLSGIALRELWGFATLGGPNTLANWEDWDGEAVPNLDVPTPIAEAEAEVLEAAEKLAAALRVPMPETDDPYEALGKLSAERKRRGL